VPTPALFRGQPSFSLDVPTLPSPTMFGFQVSACQSVSPLAGIHEQPYVPQVRQPFLWVLADMRGELCRGVGDRRRVRSGSHRVGDDRLIGVGAT